MFTSRLTLVCLLSCVLCCTASSEVKVVKADPGHDVILPCQGPKDADIEQLEWTRGDDYVFLFRDNQKDDEYQLPSFHGRVKLRDPQMTDGAASVVLRNVTTNDTGTYECHVATSTGKHSIKSASELISSVNLKVEHTDQTYVTAKPDEQVVLPCVRNGSVTGVEWVRTDLRRVRDVFRCKDGNLYPNHQHPYFKNLVELKDKEMKDGDVSLVLKYVTTSDSGTYECRVIERKSAHRKRSLIKLQPISTIVLDVQPGPRRAGAD